MKLRPVGFSSATFHDPATSAPLENGHVTTIWNDSVNDIDRAKLLAIKASHTSDWLFAVPISSCRLRMCDETIRVAVGLYLGLNLCEAYTCPGCALMNAWGIPGLSCKTSAMRSSRHHQVNDFIWWALKHCDVPANKELSGLLNNNGKRTDGLTLVPWQNGRCLTWDTTVVDSLVSIVPCSNFFTSRFSSRSSSRT